MSKGKSLAVITARGGSKGIPLKNIRPLNGVPMINYSISAALKSSCIEDVIVSTDDNQIAEISKAAGAEVPFFRPKELATDEARSIDVVVHAVNEYEKIHNCQIGHVILLQPTSPLRTAEDIDNAWRIYRDLNADSLQSVVETADHPYYLRKIQDNLLFKYDDNLVQENLRRQELEKVYRVNGAIYIAKRDLILKRETFIGEKNAAYIMPSNRSIDIDKLLDFGLAELILANKLE